MNRLLRFYSLSALLLGLTLGPVTLDAQDRDLRAERIVLDDDAADGGMNTLTLDPANLPTDRILTIPAPNGPGGSFLISNPTGAGGQTMSGPLSIDELRLMSATTAFYSSFLSPSGMAGSLLYTLPAVQGGVNSVLTNNGSGLLSWAAPVSTDWSLTGNAATTPGTNFLGTTDNQAFEIRVFNTDVANQGSRRVWRAEPNAASANIIGGYQGNTVTAGVAGATIGGGGNSVDANSVTDEYSTVGGGARNRAGNAAGSTTDAGYATVAGGRYNTAAYSGSVGGGWSNTVLGSTGAIAGGVGNQIGAGASYSAIPGGMGLTLNGNESFGFNSANSYPGNAVISASQVAYFGNVDLWLGNNEGVARALRFYEAQATTGAFPAAGTNFTGFRAGAQSTDITYTLPSAITGTIGDTRFLRSTTTTANTAATLDWVDAATVIGGTPVLYNVAATQAAATPRTNYLYDVAYAVGAPDAAASGARITSSAGAAGNDNATALTLTATATGSGTARALDVTAGSVNLPAVGGIITLGGSRFIHTTGTSNLFAGQTAGSLATTGTGNTGVGAAALQSVSSGNGNSALGAGALFSTTTATGNSAFGASALFAATGGSNSAVGLTALRNTTTGSGNTAVGYQAGLSNTTGSGNTLIGADANVLSLALSNAAAIGQQAAVGQSNSLVLGSINGTNGATADVTVGIGTTTPTQKLEVANGNVLLSNGGTAGELRMQGTGTGYSAIRAGAQGAADITYTLPTAAPTVDGQVLASTTAGVMSWATSSSTDWSLTGNAATTPGTDFIGTTDNQAFEIHIFDGDAANLGSKRVWRAEPNGTSANIIGGYQGNTVTAGVVGASIGGGGDATDLNTVTDEYGTVGGGAGNSAGDNAGTTTDAGYATVAGGRYNSAGNASAVGGGWGNSASGNSGVIGGGVGNSIESTSSWSAIPGGIGLTLTGSESFGFNSANSYPNNAIISASQVAYFGNVDLWLGNNEGVARALRFYEAQATTGAFPAAGTNFTAFTAGAQSDDITYTLPSAITGTIGDTRFLRSTTTTANTAATLDWVDLKAAVDGLGSIALSNNSATTPTAELTNTNASGTALQITDGRMVLSNASYASAATIGDDVIVAEVQTTGADATAATVTLPTGAVAGQILYVTTADPDGVVISDGVGTVYTLADDQLIVTLLYIGGEWKPIP